MKSIIFTALVVFAVFYLGYTQSSQVRQWADNITGGRAAGLVSKADDIKSDITQGFEHGVKKINEGIQNRASRIDTLEAEIKQLKAENDRLQALVPEYKQTISPLPVLIANDDVDADTYLSPAKRSQELLQLIQKMHIRSAGQ